MNKRRLIRFCKLFGAHNQEIENIIMSSKQDLMPVVMAILAPKIGYEEIELFEHYKIFEEQEEICLEVRLKNLLKASDGH